MSLPNLHNFMIKIKVIIQKYIVCRSIIISSIVIEEQDLFLSLFNCGALEHIHPHPRLGY